MPTVRIAQSRGRSRGRTAAGYRSRCQYPRFVSTGAPLMMNARSGPGQTDVDARLTDLTAIRRDPHAVASRSRVGTCRRIARTGRLWWRRWRRPQAAAWSGLNHDCVGQQPDAVSAGTALPAATRRFGQGQLWPSVRRRASVSWAVVAGGGSVTPTTSSTDSAGLATTTLDTRHDARCEPRDRDLGHAARRRIRCDGDGGRDSQRHRDESDRCRPTRATRCSSPPSRRMRSGNVLPGKIGDLDAVVEPGTSSLCRPTWRAADLGHRSRDRRPRPSTASQGERRAHGSIPILVTVAVGRQGGRVRLHDRPLRGPRPAGPARLASCGPKTAAWCCSPAMHRATTLSRGADFNSLRRDCSQPALVSADRRTARVLRELGVDVGRVSRRQHAGTRWCTTSFTTRSRAPADAGQSVARQPVLVQLDDLCRVRPTARGSFSKPGAPAHAVAPAPYAWVPPPPGALPARWLR